MRSDVLPRPGPRVKLEMWQKEDVKHFAKLNADPAVMEFFPRRLTDTESERLFGMLLEHFDRFGYGLWPVFSQTTHDFMGMCGLMIVGFEANFTPAVEIGWRFHKKYWGQNYALEAALLALEYGFEQLAIDEIVSFTAVQNKRSRGLMERCGFTHDPSSDFDHPNLEPGNPLRRHVLYRLDAESFKSLSLLPSRL